MATSEAAPRARGEYAKSAQRRTDIISAAVEVFSESGFRDGTLRTVAERAGMTHAGMRHHFPTKVDLLEAVLKWREVDTLQRARLAQPIGIDVIRAWIASVAENTTRPVLVELEAVLSTCISAPKSCSLGPSSPWLSRANCAPRSSPGSPRACCCPRRWGCSRFGCATVLSTSLRSFGPTSAFCSPSNFDPPAKSPRPGRRRALATLKIGAR
jgi:hypothetical protein